MDKNVFGLCLCLTYKYTIKNRSPFWLAANIVIKCLYEIHTVNVLCIIKCDVREQDDKQKDENESRKSVKLGTDNM